MKTYVLGRGRRPSARWRRVVVLAAIVPVAAVGARLMSSGEPSAPLPANVARISEPVAAQPVYKKMTLPMPWPGYGQSAYGVMEDGVLAQSNDQEQPVPIASVAKVFTALAVLRQKPLAPGEQGPLITLTEQDVASYRDYLAKDGTVVPVESGEQISQYQALQAMLLPSSNNMSDTLARWAFGSVDAYNRYANQMVRELGFTRTTIDVASGYSPRTQSTAREVVKAGILYMQNPVLREIAGQSEAVIPVAGRISSFNTAINDAGVLGLKVGFTDEASSTFLAASVTGAQPDQISVAAVLGAGSMPAAMRDAKTLLAEGDKGHARAQTLIGKQCGAGGPNCM